MQPHVRHSGGRAQTELRAMRVRVAGAAIIGLGVLAFWLLKDSGAW